MTKGEIEAQGWNPELIENTCNDIIKETQRDDFSIKYIRGKVDFLIRFTGDLNERKR